MYCMFCVEIAYICRMCVDTDTNIVYDGVPNNYYIKRLYIKVTDKIFTYAGTSTSCAKSTLRRLYVDKVKK